MYSPVLQEVQHTGPFRAAQVLTEMKPQHSHTDVLYSLDVYLISYTTLGLGSSNFR
jgi:hypothetical protein